MILAGVAIVVAGVFLWRWDLDKAFVAAALGIVAWFLNYRVRMKKIAVAADLENEMNPYEEEQYEDLDEE